MSHSVVELEISEELTVAVFDNQPVLYTNENAIWLTDDELVKVVSFFMDYIQGLNYVES